MCRMRILRLPVRCQYLTTARCAKGTRDVSYDDYSIYLSSYPPHQLPSRCQCLCLASLRDAFVSTLSAVPALLSDQLTLWLLTDTPVSIFVIRARISLLCHHIPHHSFLTLHNPAPRGSPVPAPHHDYSLSLFVHALTTTSHPQISYSFSLQFVAYYR